MTAFFLLSATLNMLSLDMALVLGVNEPGVDGERGRLRDIDGKW